MNVLHKGLLLGLTALAALSGIAAQADTVTQFDFPSGSNTRALGINDSGNVVGVFNPSSGGVRGYERSANGTFSAAIADPSDNQNFTRATGINNSGTIVGDYLTQTNVTEYHGYILKNGTFTTFDVGGPFSTDIFAINNNGDFAGFYGSSAQQNEGFLDVGGTLTTFNGPTGNTATYVNGMNNSDVVVGNYHRQLPATSTTALAGTRRPASITTIDVTGAIQHHMPTESTISEPSSAATRTNPNDYHGFVDKAGVITPFDPAGRIVHFDQQHQQCRASLWAITRTTTATFHGYIDTPSASGHAQLLWNKTDGTASLWTVNPDNSFASITYGPFAGWTAKAVAAAPDGSDWLLWTNTNADRLASGASLL